MRKFLLGGLMLMYVLIVFASKDICKSEIIGYKIVKNSVFPFKVDKKKSCFFAFYTTNPDPTTDAKGNGNLGDAIWYGYYQKSNPDKIYEFPKPSGINWNDVCSINAVSFYDMNGDKIPDVTIIGSCDKNAINYSIPLVFIWHGDKYLLDEDVYRGIYGFIGLTVADVREYIKSPESYFKVLEARNKLYEPCK